MINGLFNNIKKIDSDFNVGLNIDGYTNPTTYKVPHISFGINTFRRRSSTYKTFGQSDEYTSEEYVNEMLAGYQETPTVKRYRVFKECYASYVCYPLITGEGKYNVSGSTDSNMTNLSRNVDLNLTNIYDVLTFSAAEESGFKLASWHFHIKHINKSFYKLKLVDSTKTGKERYSFYDINETSAYRKPITIGGADEALVMFFEYRKPFKYPQDGETAISLYKQKLWPEFDNNAIILVRRLVRNEKGEPLKNVNGEYQWKLCVHALSDVNYTLKTWKISDGSFEQTARFFNDEILKNVIEFDTEELDKICDDDYHFWVCNRFYAEEISDGDISGDSYDESNYTLIQKDVLLEQEYRTYNELESEEWKKVKSEVSECVDDTTCKLFKDYSQQILPSTTIVKGMKCDVSETVVSDEFVRSLETQKVNVSEWQTEIIGIKENEFVKAFFKVYFDDLDGNNISTVEYIINSKTEYERFLNGMLGDKPVLNYPQIGGESVPFWYMSSNRSFVESGLELPDAYRYGMDYNMVDIVKHTGVHFLPYNRFDAVTYNVYFYDTDGGLLSTRTETITSKSDYEKIEAGTKTSIQTPPTVSNLEYWVKEGKRTVDPSQHTANDKYGTTTTQSIDLYKNNGVKFYPVTYEAVTYNVYFHSPKGTVMKEESKTISTLDDFNKFIKGELDSQYVEVPTTISIDGYVDNPIGFWVKEDKWDKAKMAIKSDEVGNEDKYGDGENMSRVDLSNYLMFGDKKELHFYPFVGVNDINHIVISFNMNPIVGTQNKDLDNLTEIYNADTGEKLLGPIGWASVFVNPYSTQPSRAGTYQYGYDVNSDDVVSYNANSTNPSFFGHSGDNQGEGYEGIYVYVNPIDKVQYNDEINMKKLCSKALSEVYPEVQLFKIKIYGEWHDNGNAALGSKANIKVNAYKGGYPIRTKQSFYDIGAMKLKNGESEELKTYFYGNTNIAIWSRSKLFDGGFGPNSENEINNSKYDKIYDYMGYILYNPLLKSAQYVEPIIVGKRSGEYLPIRTINFPETTKFVDGANVNSWADLPFYADPDEYDISLEMKNGYTEAQRLDGTTIYVKKKLV